MSILFFSFFTQLTLRARLLFFPRNARKMLINNRALTH